jgi:hypothetical protein
MAPPSTVQVDIGPQAYGKDSTLGANSAIKKAANPFELTANPVCEQE